MASKSRFSARRRLPRSVPSMCWYTSPGARQEGGEGCREAPISKEMLLKILKSQLEASKAVIERCQTQIELLQIIPSLYRHTRHSLVPNASP